MSIGKKLDTHGFFIGAMIKINKFNHFIGLYIKKQIITFIKLTPNIKKISFFILTWVGYVSLMCLTVCFVG